MSNIIFYFTGTGNSLTVARDIAEKLGDTKIVSITEAIKESHMDLAYERIGFVFPCYFASTPKIVKRFIEKLNFNRSQYIFGIITFGGAYGAALSRLGQYIAERGGHLDAGFSIRMPGNYINKYNAMPSGIQHKLFKGEKKKVNEISKAVKAKSSVRIPKGSIFVQLTQGSFDKAINSFDKMAENYHINERCSGCGTCERICPVGNIKMVDKKPNWGNTCEQCVACIQWCPAKAIEYADKTAKRSQYKHPEVKVSDLL